MLCFEWDRQDERLRVQRPGHGAGFPHTHGIDIDGDDNSTYAANDLDIDDFTPDNGEY